MGFFLAFFPPKETIDYIRDTNRLLNKEARNFRFVELQQVHMTLQFLGNAVSTNSLNLVREAIANQITKLDAPQISLERLQFGFKGQHNPQVLFWTVEVNSELKIFTRQIHKMIKDLDLYDIKKQKDYAKLIYHITVARGKRPANKSYARKINEEISKFSYQEINFRPEKLHLVASSQTNKAGNPKYTSLATYNLS